MDDRSENVKTRSLRGDLLTGEIINAAIKVHRRLGPGLLESAYQNTVIVELKAIARANAVHEAQLLSHMKLSGLQLGLLINFHSLLLRDGIERMISG